jgi:broad specificity phosphatase PhoE
LTEPVTRILLLRHAQSTWNAEGRWQGRSDPPLSPRGEADVAAASSSAALDQIEAVAASDLVRAVRTAELMAEGRAWGRIHLLPGLRERDVGDFAGRTRAEIEERWPGALHRVPLDPPGAESRVSLLARAVASLHRIAERHPNRTVLAVTHGALIRALETHLGVTEPTVLVNLSGRWVAVDDGALVLGDRVELLAGGTGGTGETGGTSATSPTAIVKVGGPKTR